MEMNEYSERVCIYCGSKRVRKKLKKDFYPGERLSKQPSEYFEYLICDNCKETTIKNNII